MNKQKSHIIALIIALIGVFMGLGFLTYFNNNIVENLPVLTRFIAMIFSQWVLLVVPIILMIIYQEHPKNVGLRYTNLSRQILIGVVTALFMSFVFTLLPLFLGFEGFKSDSPYTSVFQIAYFFLYTLVGVAFAEEFIFRGYVYHKLIKITNSQWSAIFISSIIFGLFHIFNGGLVQVVITSILGIVLCVVKVKFANNSLVAPIVAHGIYNVLIVVFSAIL